MVMSNPSIWAIPRHQVRTLVSGPHLSSWHPLKYPLSFLDSGQGNTRILFTPAHEVSWVHLSNDDLCPLLGLSGKHSAAPLTLLGLEDHVRVYHVPLCRHPSTIPTLLLPHHTAKSCIFSRMSPSHGDQGTGPLSRKHQWLYPSVLLSYWYCCSGDSGKLSWTENMFFPNHYSVLKPSESGLLQIRAR